MASVTIDGLSARDMGFLAEMVQLTAGWTDPLANSDIGFAAIDIITRKWKRTPAEPNRSRSVHDVPPTRQRLVDLIRSRGSSDGNGQVDVGNIPALTEGRLAEMRALVPTGGAALTDAEIGRAAIRMLTEEWGRSPLDTASSTMRKTGTRSRQKIVRQLGDLRP